MPIDRASTAPRVLVTGGAGYIGSHTCKALARSGFLPVSYDNLSRGHTELVKWGPLEIGDVRNSSRLRDVLAAHRPVATLHFAAFAEVAESVRDPQLYRDNNVGGMQSLLAALGAAGRAPIVLSSSSSVYGTPARLPVDEQNATRPLSPYGESKLECEKLLRAHEGAIGAPAIALRYFNAAGADPDGETGEWHETESHVIPRAIMAALGRIEAFDIFGDDYPTPDGTAIRDYIHVGDLADAHVLALRHLLSGGTGGIFNLGIGRGYSVAEIVACIERATGRRVPVRKSPRRAGDPAHLVADVTQAQLTFGFAPKYLELSQMVGDAVRAMEVFLARDRQR